MNRFLGLLSGLLSTFRLHCTDPMQAHNHSPHRVKMNDVPCITWYWSWFWLAFLVGISRCHFSFFPSVAMPSRTFISFRSSLVSTISITPCQVGTDYLLHYEMLAADSNELLREARLLRRVPSLPRDAWDHISTQYMQSLFRQISPAWIGQLVQRYQEDFDMFSYGSIL